MGGHKAAARPAQDRDFDTPQGFYHVGPESLCIGKGISGIEDAAVDLAVKVLDKVAVYHGVPFSLYTAGINMQIHGTEISHGVLLICGPDSGPFLWLTYELVPKTEVLEQPHMVNRFLSPVNKRFEVIPFP
jgi:hypothetical protein